MGGGQPAEYVEVPDDGGPPESTEFIQKSKGATVIAEDLVHWEAGATPATAAEWTATAAAGADLQGHEVGDDGGHDHVVLADSIVRVCDPQDSHIDEVYRAEDDAGMVAIDATGCSAQLGDAQGPEEAEFKAELAEEPMPEVGFEEHIPEDAVKLEELELKPDCAETTPDSAEVIKAEPHELGKVEVAEPHELGEVKEECNEAMLSRPTRSKGASSTEADTKKEEEEDASAVGVEASWAGEGDRADQLQLVAVKDPYLF